MREAEFDKSQTKTIRNLKVLSFQYDTGSKDLSIDYILTYDDRTQDIKSKLFHNFIFSSLTIDDLIILILSDLGVTEYTLSDDNEER